LSRLLALVALVGLVLAGLYYRRDGAPGLPADAKPALADVSSRLGEMGRTVGATVRDTTLAGKVKAAFELNRVVEPYGLEVAIDGESVVLRGEVPTQAVKETAGRIAADVPGVSGVRNEIRVGEKPASAPAPPAGAAEKAAAAPSGRPARTTPRRIPSAIP
jgi:osmotically-inducible protein OsmY